MYVCVYIFTNNKSKLVKSKNRKTRNKNLRTRFSKGETGDKLLTQ